MSDIRELLQDLREKHDRVKYHGDTLEALPFLERLIEKLDEIESYSVTQSDLDDVEDQRDQAEAERDEWRERHDELEEKLKGIVATLGPGLGEEFKEYGKFRIIKGGKE